MSYRHNNDFENIMDEYSNYDYDDQEEQREDDENYDVDDFMKERDHRTNSTLAGYEKSLQIYDFLSGRSILHNLSHSKEHPLEIIEQQERDILAKLGNQTGLESQFLVTTYEKKMDKNYKNVTYMVLETISNHCFQDPDNSLPLHNEGYWGAPKCLAVLSQKYIAIGTSDAVVIVFDLDESTAKKFGTLKEQNYGAVTAMDLTTKDETLVCGYESGHIVLWGIVKAELIKAINPVDKSPILSVKFWKETKNNIIVSNAKGMVYLYKADYNFFLNWTVEKKPLLDLSVQDKQSTLDPLSHLPDGFFSIQVLKKDLTKGHSLNKHTVIAVGSMKMVLILTLEPSVNIVYRYDRPDELSDTAIPCLSWGKGALPNQENNSYPILAISWGQDLHLFQCQNFEQEGKGIKFTGYYHSDVEITHLEWISENNILTYDSNREFKILTTGLFEIANSNKQEDIIFNYSAAIINTQLVDPDINFQVYNLKDHKNDETHDRKPTKFIKYYTNSLTASITLRSIFILGSKKLYYGQHLDWKEYIENMATNEDWIRALATFIALSKGTNRLFAGLSNRVNERKEMMSQYGADLIRQYIQSVERANKKADSPYCEDIWKTVVLTVIDFLISVDNFLYLFQDMKKTFDGYNLRNLFMECLEPFILRNRVKYIPNEPFLEIAHYYYEKDKLCVLQHLMLNLDLDEVDPDVAISICMKYNLLTALFYLSTQKSEDPDFMTPIARSLSLYQKSVEEDCAENLNYGLTFLWFVFMTIKGKRFPYGAIPQKLWEENVKDIIGLVLEENNLNLMIQIQPHVSFEVLRILFEPKLAILISSYDQNSIRLIADQEKFDMRVKTDESAQVLKYALDLFSNAVGNKIQGQMLALIYHCGKKKKSDGQNCQNLMFYMMASLAVHLAYKIPDEVIEECLLYILKNKREVSSWEIVRKKLDERNEEEEGNPLTEERSGLICGLLKELEGKLVEKELAVLQRITDHTDFVDVKVFFASLKKDYKKALDLYIGQSTRFQKMKVFNWLDETIYFVKTNQPDDFKELKGIIISYLNSLVSIDSDRSRKIIASIDATLEINAIKLLEASPQLQLEYLKGLLTQNEKGVRLDEDILILHMKLLCQLYPKEVIIQVEERNYPSEECLKLCRHYNVKDGIAYFSEQSGNIMEALDLLLDLFRKKLEKKLKKIDQTKLFEEEGLTTKLQNIKKICRRHSTTEDVDPKRIWFRVLDKMVEWYLAYIVNNKLVKRALNNPQDLEQNAGYKRFANAYSEYISEIFDEMTRNVHADDILSKLQDYRELKLGDLRKSLIRMLEAYFSDNIIFNNAKDMIIGESHESVSQLYDMTTTGIQGEKTTMDIDSSDTINVYNCGHVLPNIYLQSRLCPVCSKTEDIRAKKVINSAKKGTRRSIARNSVLETATAKGSILEASESAKSFVVNEPDVHNYKLNNKNKYLRKLIVIEQNRAETLENWNELEDQQNVFLM